MEYDFYLKKFEKAAASLDKQVLTKKGLEVNTGTVLESVVLKLYKKQWTNNSTDPLNATTRIFFSVWLNDNSILHNKLFYNIHAFKLRQLKDYSIGSRDFAEQFRKQFKRTAAKWENVSTQFRPLTLMEGWKELDNKNLESNIIALANNFLTIEQLIDNTLKLYKK